MVRISRSRLLSLGVLAVVVGGAVWYINRSEPIPTKPPAGAPTAGTCFQVNPEQAQQTMPWPGGPAACSSAHTAEVFFVGQVDHDLISKSRTAKGDTAKVAMNLMFAEVRRACGAFAETYLGGSWHRDQLTLLANWIAPPGNGFFGCALAQVTGPGGNTYVTRTASVHGAGENGPLAIGCVTRTGDAIRFASCDEPHSGEFVGTYQITPANAQFDATAVANAATQGCTRAALEYLGLPDTGSRTDLHIGYVGPTTAGTWLGSDQVFGCYASSTAMMRGTIRNLGSRPLPT